MKLQRTSPALIILSILGLLSYLLINILSHSFGELETDTRASISKEEAAAAAIRYVEEHGRLKEGSELNTLNALNSLNTLVTLQTHKAFNGYLNKNNLHDIYTKGYHEMYPLDYFQVILTSEGRDLFLIDIHMKSAEIIGWKEVAAVDKKITQNAQDTVEAYLNTLHINLAEYTLISQPTGSDPKYVYENLNQWIGKAMLQLHITVHDDEVTSFHALFNVPDSYKDWVKQQDISTSTMSMISMILSVLMALTALILSIVYRKEISFTRGLLLSLTYTILSSIHSINMYPAYKAMFAGETSSTETSIFYSIFYIVVTFIMGAAVYFSLLSGDALWRKEGKHLWARWSQSGYGNHVLNSMGKGYLFCLIILGFQAVIFFVGEQVLGVWSVNDPLFSSYNLLIPVLFPLLAVAAAISEEAIYRVFGIIIFKKIVKNTFIAVLISSMIWALGHTQYPIYPAYTRFIEVTLLGLIFGYIYLKHGFLTAVFTHTSVNIIMMGLSLMVFPGGTFHSLMGVFYIASPALFAYLISMVHSGSRLEVKR